MMTRMFAGLGAATLAAAAFSGLSVTATGKTPAIDPSTLKTEPGGCAWVGRHDSWQAVNDDMMIVKTSPSKRYLVTFNGPCREQRDAHNIKFTRHYTSCLSPGDDVEFGQFFGTGFRDYSFRGFCSIAKVERIVPNPAPEQSQ
jgi:hypothetical protein